MKIGFYLNDYNYLLEKLNRRDATGLFGHSLRGVL